GHRPSGRALVYSGGCLDEPADARSPTITARSTVASPSRRLAVHAPHIGADTHHPGTAHHPRTTGAGSLSLGRPDARRRRGAPAAVGGPAHRRHLTNTQ